MPLILKYQTSEYQTSNEQLFIEMRNKQSKSATCICVNSLEVAPFTKRKHRTTKLCQKYQIPASCTLWSG